ncbi:DUF6318 family protein [Glutamicibacter ectropisis]|uniref:DUF6318 family protein n=1 Tax=Glutamicibacter ectropisis TaxID=3046593 RepID=A0AAU6WA87_9MICC
MTHQSSPKVRGESEMNKSRLLVAAIGTALLLSGCDNTTVNGPLEGVEVSGSASSETSFGNDSKTAPNTTPSYIQATSEGPAKNVVLPAMPKDAQEFSEKGASSFVEYYFELLNYTIESNDAEEIKDLSFKECSLCNKSIIDEAEEAQKSGEWQVGGKHHPTILDSYISGKNIAIVTVEYTADPAKIYSSPGTVQEELKEIESNRLAFDLEYDKGWRVYKIIGAN